MKPPTYVYNMQVHRSTAFTPFLLVLTGVPAGPAMLILRTADDFTSSSAPSDQTPQTADVLEMHDSSISLVRIMIA